MAAKKKPNETNAKVYIVETPVKNFCGIGAGGVQFAYGKAEVNEGWVLDWYREHGYKVTAKAAEGTGEGTPSENGSGE